MSDDGNVKPIYVNVARVTQGPFDITLDFGYKTPEQGMDKSEDYEIVARIAMSPQLAKIILPLLARQIAEYEKQMGQIPVPELIKEGEAND